METLIARWYPKLATTIGSPTESMLLLTGARWESPTPFYSRGHAAAPASGEEMSGSPVEIFLLVGAGGAPHPLSINGARPSLRCSIACPAGYFLTDMQSG